jgi:hypothetical protein
MNSRAGVGTDFLAIIRDCHALTRIATHPMNATVRHSVTRGVDSLRAFTRQ